MKTTQTIILFVAILACLACSIYGLQVQTLWQGEDVLALNEGPVSHLDTKANLYYIVTDFQVTAFDANSGAIRKQFKIPDQNCHTRSVTFTSGKSMWYSHVYNVLPTFVMHQVDLETGKVTDYSVKQYASQGYITKALDNGNILIAVVSTQEDQAHHNVVAAFQVGSKFSHSWSYMGDVRANLITLAFDEEQVVVIAVGSDYITKIDARTGKVLYTSYTIPSYINVMPVSGQLSPDKRVLYLTGSNQLRGESGAGLMAIDATNGQYLRWYGIPGEYAFQMKRSVDGSHLYLSSEAGTAMFCMKSSQIAWSRVYETPNDRFTISAIGSQEHPVIAYASSGKNVTQFVDPEDTGKIIGTFLQYLGENLTSNGTDAFFTYLSPKHSVRVSKRQLV